MVMSDYEQLNTRALYFDNKQTLKVTSTFRDEHKFKDFNSIISNFITRNINGYESGPI